MAETNYFTVLLRCYFSKLMATGSLFLGIESSGGIDSPIELIPRRNRFLLHNTHGTLRKKAKVLDEKTIRVSKAEVSWAFGYSIPH